MGNNLAQDTGGGWRRQGNEATAQRRVPVTRKRRQCGVCLLRGVGLVGMARKMSIDGTLNPKITKFYISKQAWGFNEVI